MNVPAIFGNAGHLLVERYGKAQEVLKNNAVLDFQR
jgi:hypothetical protein